MLNLGPQNEQATALELLMKWKRLKLLLCQKWDQIQSSTCWTYSKLRIESDLIFDSSYIFIIFIPPNSPMAVPHSFWGPKSVIGHQCLVWGLIRTLFFLNLLNMIMIETYSLPKLKLRENRVLIRPHTRHWCPITDLGSQNEHATALGPFGERFFFNIAVSHMRDLLFTQFTDCQ